MNETQSAGNGVNTEEDKKNQAPVLRSIPVVLGIAVIATAGLLMGLHSGGNSTVWIRFLGHHFIVARSWCLLGPSSTPSELRSPPSHHLAGPKVGGSHRWSS